MATQILRTVDRWRFEVPLALALAAAAGFAMLAMPHEIFRRLPVAGDLGRIGHIALAVIAALLCGALGYVAMRRPGKPAAADEDDGKYIYTPLVGPVADVIEHGPVRLRRADRHPDAPARAPIRASRDLGEPFMEVGSPAETPAHVEPTFAEAVPAEVEDEPIEHPVEEASAAVEPVEHLLTQTADEAPEAPVSAAPVAEASIAAPAPQPSFPFGRVREDTSLAAMIERLSAGMQQRGESAVRPIPPARDRNPALRDALDELNRLAERRG